MTVWVFIVIALFGLLIGILSGMFGVGGGIMIIPTLNLVFHLPALASAATSLFVVAPTSISGAYRNFRQGNIDIKAALMVGSAGACASTISSLFSEKVPDLIILLLSACLIIYCAISIIRGAFKLGKEAQEQTPKTFFKSSFSLFAARIVLGVFAGSMAGIVGLGGGFIIVPLAISLFGYSFKQATAVSLLSIAIIAVPGIVTHAILGHVWYLYGLALMVGTIPGANIGVRIVSKIPEKAIRLAFGALLVCAGVMLVASKLLPGA